MGEQKQLTLSRKGKYFVEDLRDLPDLEFCDLKIQNSQHRVWLEREYSPPIRPVYGVYKYLVKVEECIGGEWVLVNSYEPPTKLNTWRWLKFKFDLWLYYRKPFEKIKFIGYGILVLIGLVVIILLVAVASALVGTTLRAIIDFFNALFWDLKMIFS
jgi:hypothetical protein